MATVLDLINESYRVLNVIGLDDQSTSSQSTNAFNVLNRLLESLNLKKLFPYFNQQEVFSLTAAQQTYTIGSGGDFNTTRPKRILKMTVNAGDNNYPMQQLDYQEWLNIYNLTSTSEIPHYFYYESDYPLGKLYIYYKPSSSSNTVTIASEKEVSAFALKTSTVSLPPGYERFLVYGLAKELLVKHPSEAAAPLIMQYYEEAKRDIERLNVKNIMGKMSVDYNMILGTDNNREYFWNGN